MFRIIYYHVPSFSVCFVFFALSLLGSIGFLAFRHHHPDRAQIADALALAGAEVGVVFCTVVPDHRPALGPPRLGHVVDMGCATDHDTGSLAHLRQLPAFAPLCRRAPDADPRRRAGNLRRARRADCLHVQPLVAHAASRTRLRRRRRIPAWTHPWWARSSGTCSPGFSGACSSSALRYRVERRQQKIAADEAEKRSECLIPALTPSGN